MIKTTGLLLTFLRKFLGLFLNVTDLYRTIFFTLFGFDVITVVCISSLQEVPFLLLLDSECESKKKRKEKKKKKEKRQCESDGGFFFLSKFKKCPVICTNGLKALRF